MHSFWKIKEFLHKKTYILENLKEQHLFQIKIFYNIKNVFTFTFDQFNTSLLKKVLISLKIKK